MELIQKIKDQLNSEAVSPVIGVILMVAITVILAAVVGAFVFGMDNPDEAPQASLKADAIDNSDGTYIEITHQGGDTLLQSDTNVTYAGEDIDEDLPNKEFSVGDSIYITGDDTDAVKGDLPDTFTKISDTDSDVRVIDTESEQLILNENPRFA